MNSNISGVPPSGGSQDPQNIQGNQKYTMPMSAHDMSNMANKLTLFAKLGQKGLTEQMKLDASIEKQSETRNKEVDNQNK